MASEDFKFFRRDKSKWVEGDHVFDLLLDSDVELPFKLTALREMKDISITVDVDIPYSVALVDDLDGIHTFTVEDTYDISHISRRKSKFLVLKLSPPKTGNYKGAFRFDYKVQ